MLSKTSTWFISDKYTKVVTMHPLLVIFANEKAAITAWIFGSNRQIRLSLDNEYYCKNFFPCQHHRKCKEKVWSNYNLLTKKFQTPPKLLTSGHDIFVYK